MAKSRPHSKHKKRAADGTDASPPTPMPRPAELLIAAAEKLQQGDVEGAATLGGQALAQMHAREQAAATTDDDTDDADDDVLAALMLLGEIHVELGDVEGARAFFSEAVSRDPDGDAAPDEAGGGADKFLWLAQLSEEGGLDSVRWFERGAAVLRAQLQTLEAASRGTPTGDAAREIELLLAEKRRKLATALCSVAEVYMTDLSWEADAEHMCEQLVTEATMVAGEFAEAWQTLASVRISQSRTEEAQAALRRSMEVWRDVDPEDARVPDFATRVSLARLLMEVDMDEEAIVVLERLVGEDDSSVEVWYLGGWGLYMAGEKQQSREQGEGHKVSWISSRQWLNQCLKLFAQQDYEDDRLKEHALELVAKLDRELGGPATADEDEWEEEEEEDEEMGDA